MAKRRRRRRKRRPGRLVVALLAVTVIAAVGLWALWRIGRPASEEAFRFPEPAATSRPGTAEIEESERQRLKAILEGKGDGG